MPWMIPAAIVGTGLLGADAAKSAANTQSGAADRASQVQLQMFDKTQQNLDPWLQSGKISLEQIQRLVGLPSSTRIDNQGGYWTRPGGGVPDSWVPDDPNAMQFNQNAPLVKPFGLEDFKASPAYNFNLEQGQKAIDKAAAARGKFYAPGTLQDISRFSQGLASNEFQNAYSNYNNNLNNIWTRLQSLSGSGQNAAANLGAFGQNVASSVGNNITGAANAQAAGTVGAANAITGAGSNAYNSYLLSQILAQNQGSTVPGVNLRSAGANDIPGWNQA